MGFHELQSCALKNRVERWAGNQKKQLAMFLEDSDSLSEVIEEVRAEGMAGLVLPVELSQDPKCLQGVTQYAPHAAY